MSLAAKLSLTPPRSPLRLRAELADQLEAFARGLGLRGAEVVALGLQLLDEQLEAAPELVRSRVLVLQAQRPDASAPTVAGR
ncbi:MAG: hypothetical protein MUF34_28630 [Polyangiaceae bacterium]|jgi:hypothetical protein|nr:hypothetical protein [Polyangiaceae bacterium]